MKARIEFETQPIKHIAIQCPNCEKWFYGEDLAGHPLRDVVDVMFAHYECPVCGKTFDGKIFDYVECGDSEEVYKDCLTKKVKWE